MATDQGTYEEIGVVLAVPPEMDGGGGTSTNPEYTKGVPSVGDKVYFDAWLAAKFPSEKEGEWYWLVKWEHIRAVEHVEG